MYHVNDIWESYDFPGSIQELKSLNTSQRKQLIIDLMERLYYGNVDVAGGYPEMYFAYLQLPQGYVCYMNSSEWKGGGLELYTNKRLHQMFHELCWYMGNETYETEEEFVEALSDRLGDIDH